MSLIAALLLLTAASDSFDALSSQWGPGVRGLPDVSFAVIDGDTCAVLRATTVDPTPGTDDWIRSFPRPVLASERPLAQYHVYVPSFASWPTAPVASGTFNYCGCRLTITRTQGSSLVWPGIFLSRFNGQPALTVRILGDHFGRYLTEEGWWTLAVGTRESPPVLAFYASPGKVALTESDLFFVDPDPYTTVRSFDGWFLQVGTSEPWFFSDVQLYASIRPILSISPEFEGIKLSVTGGYPAERYELQHSVNLAEWESVAVFIGDGSRYEPIAAPNQFYRVAP